MPLPNSVSPLSSPVSRAQKAARVRFLFAQLDALGKSEHPADDSARQKARDELVLMHQDLAHAATNALFRKRRGGGLTEDDLDDLFQEAQIGLCKAVARFDPTRGVVFATYAWLVMNGAMLHYLRKGASLISEPEERTRERLAQERAAADAGKNIELSARPQAVFMGLFNLNDEQEGKEWLSPFISPDPAPLLTTRLAVRDALESYAQSGAEPAKRARAVTLYFFDDKSYTAIAADMGFSIAYARELVLDGLAALKTRLDCG